MNDEYLNINQVAYNKCVDTSNEGDVDSKGNPLGAGYLFAVYSTPSKSPTYTPTIVPTRTPTYTPTIAPTSTPTYTPTIAPTSLCVQNDTIAITNECLCGDNQANPCATGKYCYNDLCMDEKSCASNNIEKLTETCMCSDTVCVVGKFCNLGTCADFCETSADAITEACGYKTENGNEIKMCEANKYFYDSACQDSKPDVCVEDYYYPTKKDCTCGQETTICSNENSSKFCWDGVCTNSAKCAPLSESNAFYGGKVYGKWFESERKMGMSITTPRQIKITQINFLNAKSDALKYIDTKTMTNITDWRIYGHCYDCNVGDLSNPASENYDSLVQKGWNFSGEKSNWVFNTNGYNVNVYDENSKAKISYTFKNSGSSDISIENNHDSGTIDILKGDVSQKIVQPGATETLNLDVVNGDVSTTRSNRNIEFGCRKWRCFIL